MILGGGPPGKVGGCQLFKFKPLEAKADNGSIKELGLDAYEAD